MAADLKRLPPILRSRRQLLLAAALTLIALIAIVIVITKVMHAPGTTVQTTIARPGVLPVPRVEPVALLKVAPELARDLNAKRPIDVATIPAARPFGFTGDAVSRDRAIACLAAAGWYEAGDDAIGQGSVMQVVLNRARHPAFPRTICGVVFQGSERTTGCQFTFACDGALVRTPSLAAWQRARDHANAMLNGRVFSAVGWSTHYHTDWVVPYWSPTLVKAAKIKTQIFYLWPGFWGTGAAFRQTVTMVEAPITALARLAPSHAERGALTLDLAASVDGAAPPIAVDQTPIVLEGVSKRSLGTTLVRGQHADQNRYFVQLDRQGYAGTYAIAALAICKGKPRCTVLGWQDVDQLGEALPLSPTQRAALSFVYIRNDRVGELALWNCAQADRPNKRQCLPTAHDAIDGLIAGS